jgi:hypothetical protein
MTPDSDGCGVSVHIRAPNKGLYRFTLSLFGSTPASQPDVLVTKSGFWHPDAAAPDIRIRCKLYRCYLQSSKVSSIASVSVFRQPAVVVACLRTDARTYVTEQG